MGRLLLAIIAFSMAMVVLAKVILAIIIAGLIFRTKETIALLMLGRFLTLLSAHPAIALGLLGLMIVAAIMQASKKGGEAQLEDQPE